jgi:mono/diheme cytochrome c family protein
VSKIVFRTSILLAQSVKYRYKSLSVIEGVAMKREREIIISATSFYRRDMASRALLLALVCIFSKVSVSAQQPPPQQQVHPQQSTEFPDGPGKDAFLKTCSRCHSPTLVIANGQDREGWENTITKMVSLGAVGTDEDFTAILDYLVKNFPQQPKINVNKQQPQR